MAKEIDNSEKIKTIIADQFGVEQETLTSETTMGSLNADGLDYLEVGMELEDVFDINIPDDEFYPLTTVGGIIEYVNRKIRDKAEGTRQKAQEDDE